MSETIEWRLVLRDEANRALDATRARLDAMGAEATKAAFGVRHVEDQLGKLKAAAVAAQPPVAAVDAKMTTLQTSAAAASRSVATVGTALSSVQGPAQRAWASLNTVDGKMLTLGEQAKALQQKMGPASAAISGVSAALGQQAGQAGKAINAVGQLVAAFGAGGPFGLALAAGALAVGALSTAWDDAIKAQDAAMEKSFAAVTKTIKGVKDASVALREMQIATGAFKEAPVEQRREIDAQAAVDKASVDLDRAQSAKIDRAATAAAAEEIAGRHKQVLEILTVGLIPAEADYVGQVALAEDLQKANVRMAQRRLDIAKEQLEVAKDARRVAAEQPLLDDAAKNRALFKKIGAVDKPKSSATPAADLPDGDTLADWQQRGFERAAAEQKAQEKMAADRFAKAVAAAEKRTEAEVAIEKAAAEKSVEQRTKLERDFINLKIDLAEKAARESKAIDDAIEGDRMALAQSATTALVGEAQNYFAAKIAGGEEAKYAEQAAAAAALKGIGDQLVGFGVMQEFKAAALGIESLGLDPRTYTLGAVGLGSIAAGLGMGAGSAGISAGIPKAGGGDAARSTGASTSSRSTSSSSGAPSTTTINITYGGPTGAVAEEVAKATFKAGRNNDKRGRR